MKSIYSKIFIGFLISILVSFSVAGYFVLKINTEETVEYSYDELSNLAEYVVETLKDSSNDDDEVLKTISDSMDISFLVYSPGMGFYNYSKFDYVDRNVVSFYESNEDTYTRKSGSLLTIGMKLELDGESYALFLQMDISEQTSIFERSALLAVGCVFIIGSLVFLVVADIIVKPLSRLSKATQELAKGNYNVVVNYDGRDEIGQLSKNLNYLASQLSASEQTRQRFISEISHEFQTPLTSIEGFATILKNEDLPPEQRKKYADIILFESKRLSTLSKNMLQLTLLEGEDVSLDIQSYDLNDQLERVVESLRDSADAKNIEIEMQLSKKITMIEGDQNRLEQVWINIINNAIKYTNDDGYISISTKKTGQNVEVKISDTGIGMSEDALHHIFERFYREDKARSISGNGLGLSIVKSIVELHKGTVDVKSEKDVGSEFYITLPLKQKK